MNKFAKKSHLSFLFCIVCYANLAGCQLPKELFPETTKYKIEQQQAQQTTIPPSDTHKQPFKKVTQEEQDRAEREEYDRKKCREAFEMLRALS